MKTTECRFVRLTENIEIPVPKDCTLEEEQVFIAKFKAQNDLAELDKECQELGKALKEDNLLSLEELLRQLEIDTETPQKTV